MVCEVWSSNRETPSKNTGGITRFISSSLMSSPPDDWQCLCKKLMIHIMCFAFKDWLVAEMLEAKEVASKSVQPSVIGVGRINDISCNFPAASMHRWLVSRMVFLSWFHITSSSVQFQRLVEAFPTIIDARRGFDRLTANPAVNWNRRRS